MPHRAALLRDFLSSLRSLLDFVGEHAAGKGLNLGHRFLFALAIGEDPRQ
jgi:hypothetical protein